MMGNWRTLIPITTVVEAPKVSMNSYYVAIAILTVL